MGWNSCPGRAAAATLEHHGTNRRRGRTVGRTPAARPLSFGSGHPSPPPPCLLRPREHPTPGSLTFPTALPCGLAGPCRSSLLLKTVDQLKAQTLESHLQALASDSPAVRPWARHLARLNPGSLNGDTNRLHTGLGHDSQARNDCWDYHYFNSKSAY